MYLPKYNKNIISSLLNSGRTSPTYPHYHATYPHCHATQTHVPQIQIYKRIPRNYCALTFTLLQTLTPSTPSVPAMVCVRIYLLNQTHHPYLYLLRDRSDSSTSSPHNNTRHPTPYTPLIPIPQPTLHIPTSHTHTPTPDTHTPTLNTYTNLKPLKLASRAASGESFAAVGLKIFQNSSLSPI